MTRTSIPASALAAALATALAALSLSGCASTAASPSGGGGAGEHWVATWGAAQMVPGAQEELAPAQWRDATLRQVVRVSTAGGRVRVKLSNAMGVTPLVIDAASIAVSKGPGSAALDPGSLRPLRFGGSASVTIPGGAEYLSDPVDLAVPAGADLALSLHFPSEPSRQTSHPGSRATSYVAAGRHVMDADLPGAATFSRWYQIAEVDVQAAPPARAVVAIGDSITDGYGVATDTNTRWTDGLATRLRTQGMGEVGVVNAGIGGGRLLRDGLGPNMVSRFERDVLDRAGVSHAIVMIGVNDFGIPHRNKEDTPAYRAQLVPDMEQAQRQLVAQAHARGVCVIGGTITPYSGSAYYAPGPENEADRLAYNRFVRESGVFDGVADFDAALRDPARPSYLKKEYDNDGLHPNKAGYAAMAQAVPLELLMRCKYAR
ncbi:SGNH/GDSL hydrolase family protein [Massilia sp. 9096]|uniref:SGNH/GDSL hydrolase family protein n=1 Tax=Massilia sp. 9096 TaxID=1500894 RepID=UPI00068CEB18|nr:SGNH/GDSL hydrolase family protein [Massilia sp. 9096]